MSSGTASHQLKLAAAQQKLALRVEQFNQESHRYLPTDWHHLDGIVDHHAGEWQDAIDSGESSCEGQSDTGGVISTSSKHFQNPSIPYVKPMTLNLPSELGIEKCQKLGIGTLARRELRLRRGQANDILHQLREELGYKAFVY